MVFCNILQHPGSHSGIVVNSLNIPFLQVSSQQFTRRRDAQRPSCRAELRKEKLSDVVEGAVRSQGYPCVLVCISGWWFGTSFIFPNTWDDDII